jgi:hypothetical protein
MGTLQDRYESYCTVMVDIGLTEYILNFNEWLIFPLMLK